VPFNPAQKEEFGLSLEDIWDANVTPLLGNKNSLGLDNCSIIATQYGSTSSSNTDPNVAGLLTATQPFLFPAYHLLCEPVIIVTFSPFCFLEVSNLPIDVQWPLNIGLTEFLLSLQTAMDRANQQFQTILMMLKPLLEEWLLAVSTDHSSFLIPSFLFIDVHNGNALMWSRETGQKLFMIMDRVSLLSRTCYTVIPGAYRATDSSPLDQNLIVLS
jgi:hypothetical protein